MFKQNTSGQSYFTWYIISFCIPKLKVPTISKLNKLKTASKNTTQFRRHKLYELLSRDTNNNKIYIQVLACIRNCESKQKVMEIPRKTKVNNIGTE